jgi:hypothetical protein
MGMKIELTDDDFKNALAFSHLMFKNGGLLYTSQASMSSDLLGYFSRWQNKYFEKVVLEKLLPENVEIVSDFFIYGNKVASQGIAPDLIGVKKENKVFPFAALTETGWIGVKNTPQVEIKTTKETSYLWTVTDSQVLDYLFCIETNINQDYFAKRLMSDNTFNWDQFNLDEYIDDFDNQNTGYIKKFNNINTEIKDVNWGTVELTKVIKKDDISTFFKLMGPKKSPAYIKNSKEFLSEVGQNTQGKWKTHGKKFSENLPSETIQENIIEIPKGKSSLNFLSVENSEIVKHFTESVNFLPCTISSNEPTRLEILSASNSSIYIKPYSEIVILGNTLTPDRNKAYKLKLDKFERSANRSEWCAHKSISDLITDASDEFIQVINNL